MRPLRFCHVTTFYPPDAFGGDGVFVQQLAHLLADQGHHVEVVHCLDAYNLLKSRAQSRPTYLPHDGVKVHTLQSRFGGLSPLLTHLTGRPLLKSKELQRILSRGFDVIHFHNISLVGGPAVAAMGRGLKLHTSHEYWLHCPTHLLQKWGEEQCHEKSCWACCLYQKRPPQIWRAGNLMERSLKQIDLFLCPTSYARDLHLSSGLPGTPVVLRNFVPDQSSSMNQTPRQGFLFVGRLDAVKGILELCAVFKDNPQWSLTIIGDGPLRERLQQLAAETPWIRLLGYQTPEQTAQYYRRSEALLIPSRSHELGPLVMMEAMSHCTPLIVTPTGQMEEVVQESGAGLVADSESDWQQALSSLANHPEKVVRMGERGREYYLQHFTPEVHLRTYMNYIQDRLG